MKRLLLFVLLLAIALVILRWFEGSGPEPIPPPSPPPEVPLVDTTEEPTEQERLPGLSISGFFRERFFDEKPPGRATLLIQSEDSGSQEGYDELFRVLLKGFDPATGETQAELTAASARLRRKPIGEDQKLAWEQRVEFREVHGTLHSGAPFVPLDFDTAAAVLDVSDITHRVLTSDTPVTIEAPGLQATGLGLEVPLDEAKLILLANGSIDFARGGTEGVHLECAGRLELRRLEASTEDEESPDKVEVEASDQVLLEFRGENGSTLNANHVVLLGAEQSDGSGTFLLEGIRADGEIVWVSNETEARGENAVLYFDVHGALASWSLEGNPSLEVSLALLEGVELAPDVSPDEAGFVVITGQGPLTGQALGVRSFKMGGPASVDAGEVTLKAGGDVEGRVAPDGRSAIFTSAGGVVLDTGLDTEELDDDHALETTALEVKVSRNEVGEVRQNITTVGGAVLKGPLQDGRTYSLSSRDVIEATYTRGSAADEDEEAPAQWRIDKARGVVLTVEGEGGFTARADDVTDFDPEALTLNAVGNVSIDSAEGTGGGEKLILDGPDSIRLEGTSNEPAWLERADGRADARVVELTATEDGFTKTSHLVATGDVKADFHREDVPERGYEGYDVRCKDLVVDATEVVDPDTGVVERTLHIEAKTSVDATVGWGGERTRVKCDTLTGHRTEQRQGFEEDAPILGGTTEIEADGHVISHLTYEDADLELDCRNLSVAQTEGEPDGETYAVTATGKVRFDLLMSRVGEASTDEPEKEPEKVTLSGEGDRLTFDENFHGSLTPLPGGRVHVLGHALSQNAPFELRADRFDCTGTEEFTAEIPELTIWRFEAASEGLPLEATGLRATARHLKATREALEFVDDVKILSRTREGAPWSLAAQHMILRGQTAGGASDAQFDALEAKGDVRFDLGTRGQRLDEQTIASARGDRVTADSIWGVLRLEGDRARIASPAFVSEADWIDFDPAEKIIIATGPGRMTSGLEAETSDVRTWELDYLAFTTRITPDEIIYVLREPDFVYPGSKAGLHASWALLWIDRYRWANLEDTLRETRQGPDELHVETAEPPPVYPEGSPMAKLLDFLRDKRIEDLVREVYLEGPVEMRENDDVVAEASAVYFDAIAGHGWVVDARFEITGDAVGQDFEHLRVQAEWLRHSEDGSLQARQATISTSPIANSGMRIVTGDLIVAPILGTEKEHEVILRNNRIDFYDRVRLPLPPIRFRTDDEYKPAWQSLRVADSARFGTLVSAGISRPAGRVGETINQVMGGDPSNYDAHWSLDASYLGSRGALFDLGLEVESKLDYGLDTRFGIVPDTGSDKGYIRVRKGQRDTVRRWFRADTRLDISDEEWIDVAVSRQSDPGVQSEFWENEFERYERDESYVQWRKARHEDYFDITLKARTEDFRSSIDQLPGAGLYQGRAPLFRLGTLTLLHTGETRAAYLNRQAGDTGAQSPFSIAPPLDAANAFADGFGDRRLARLDTNQRLEAPFGLGIAGVRATPFLDARFTAWSEGRNPDDRPRRFVGEAGLRLATTFWRETTDNSTHFLSPFVEMAREVGFEQTGGLVPFDATENAVGGDRISLGLRTRLDVDEKGPWLDLEVRNTYATDLRDGTPDGWLPLESFGLLRIEPWGIPAQIRHEGRYDLDDRRTEYALTSISSRITEDLGVEAGHRMARDSAGERILEAGSIASIYRWSPKWEFEARETFPLMRGNSLDTKFVLRRYGADIIFEIESSFREGEGASLGVSIRPRFGWHPPRIGYLNN